MRLPLPAGVFALMDDLRCKHDVLTEHNDLICSAGIERVVTGRDVALEQIEQLIQ